MEPQGEDSLSPKSARGAAVMVGVCGAALLALATGILPAKDSMFNAPRWIVGCIGAGLLLCAVGLFYRHLETRWTSFATLVGIALALAVPPLWIAFGVGPRECGGGLSVAGVTREWISPALECRIAFGIGGLVMVGILVMGLGAYLKSELGPSPLFTIMEKAGFAVVGTVLMALVVVGFVIASPWLLAKWAYHYSRKAGSDA